MKNLNLDEIGMKVSEGNESEAIDDYINLLGYSAENQLRLILESIYSVMSEFSDITIDFEQFEKLKKYVGFDDDDIQTLALDILTISMKNDSNLLLKECEFCKDLVKHKNSIIRSKIVELYSGVYHSVKNETREQIFNAMLSTLADPYWFIRLKSIEFFNKILNLDNKLVSRYKKEFLVILDERDLEVIGEILDFTYNLFLRTFKPEDIIDLVHSIPNSGWYKQEKILSVLGKIGKEHSEFVKPIIEDLVLLVDQDDNLLQKKAISTIIEISEGFPTLFDKILFKELKNEQFDNIIGIEEILRISIEKYSIKRFLQLFGLFSPISDKNILNNFISILNKINKNKNSLIRTIFIELTKYILENLTLENYLKYEETITAFPKYEIYLDCYTILVESSELESIENEKRRKELISHLLSLMPELGYLKLSLWINKKLRNGDIAIESLIDKFGINNENLMEIIQGLIEKNILDAVIIDNKIQKATALSIFEEKPNILFLKQWKIRLLKEENSQEIFLHIKLKNITKETIKNLRIMLKYPKELFILSDEHKTKKIIKKLLVTDEDFMFSWKFLKKEKTSIINKTTSVKIVVMYIKSGKMYTLNKKLDILLL